MRRVPEAMAGTIPLASWRSWSWSSSRSLGWTRERRPRHGAGRRARVQAGLAELAVLRCPRRRLRGHLDSVRDGDPAAIAPAGRRRRRAMDARELPAVGGVPPPLRHHVQPGELRLGHVARDPRGTARSSASTTSPASSSAGLAATIVAAVWLERAGPLHNILTDEHLHNLGKLLFAFSTFWMYIWFSQYMLIWYTNIPEETAYFLRRMQGAWSWLFALNIVLNWVVPFLVLLRRDTKRWRVVLVRISVVVLIGHWLDLYLMIPSCRAGQHAAPRRVGVGARGRRRRPLRPRARAGSARRAERASPGPAVVRKPALRPGRSRLICRQEISRGRKGLMYKKGTFRTRNGHPAQGHVEGD